MSARLFHAPVVQSSAANDDASILTAEAALRLRSSFAQHHFEVESEVEVVVSFEPSV